eukprot:Gb_21095 [translate_table: standard]
MMGTSSLWEGSGLKQRQVRSVLKAPGRETAAGRALFALYNGYNLARQRGNNYSLLNKPTQKNIDRLQNILFRPPASESKSPTRETKPQKPRVKVPRFRRRCASLEPVPKVVELRGRKRASEILQKLKEDSNKFELPPPPIKPAIDDKEKQRVQSLFEWSGRIDKEHILNPPKPRAPRVVKHKGDKEVLLDSISREIDEREAFLNDMERLGRGEQYKERITEEIEERIKQMKILDALMTQEDKGKMNLKNSSE